MRPKKEILLVDADEGSISIRKFLLATKGYAVTVAETSEQAVELFTAGTYDVVIVELSMPKGGGNELVRQLKGIRPETAMMLVSDKVRSGIPHQADCFISKDFTHYDLVERVRIMSARKRGPKKSVIEQLEYLASKRRIA